MPQPDLAHLARDLTRIHDAVLTGASPPVQPRALVKRSWDRMLRLGLDPAGSNHRVVDDEAMVESRRQRSKLRLVVEEMRSVLLRAPDAAPFILVVTDADGVILWRDGAASARRQADGLGFVEGAHWSESVVGTNAIGTALTEETDVQLFSAEHFESAQHPWYCSAVPVHDPHTGALLGIVDISGPALGDSADAAGSTRSRYPLRHRPSGRSAYATAGADSRGGHLGGVSGDQRLRPQPAPLRGR
jgi:transcriptional regulator of acetoin/glycerol metabolism